MLANALNDDDNEDAFLELTMKIQKSLSKEAVKLV